MKVFLLLIASLFATLLVKGQTVMELRDFSKFVGKNYVIAPELKTNCEWMYAIVKVQTNTLNTIVKYDFVNKPSKAVQEGFTHLIGYQFPDSLQINNRPIFFFFTIDNHDVCIEQQGDTGYKPPWSVASTVISHYAKIFKDEPNCIILSGVIIAQIWATHR